MITDYINTLLDDSTIQSLIGQNKAANAYKVYPVVCDQGETVPYIVVAVTGCEPLECKDNTGLPDIETFDTIIYSDDYEDLLAIETRVIELYNGVENTTLQTHRDLFDNERKCYVRVASFRKN